MPAGRRVLSQSLSTDPRYSRLSLKAQVLFPLLWVNADDQGRFSGDPDKIKITACPGISAITVEEIPELIIELAQQKLIQHYHTSKAEAIQFLDWWDVHRPQWAYPSEFEAPEGWQDRLRYKKGPKTTVITQNWEPIDRIQHGLTKDIRVAVMARDNYTCRVCGKTPADGIMLEIHRIFSVYDGGTNDEDNLATVCSGCQSKAEKDPKLLSQCAEGERREPGSLQGGLPGGEQGGQSGGLLKEYKPNINSNPTEKETLSLSPQPASVATTPQHRLKPHQQEAGAFLDLIEKHEGIPLLSRDKLINLSRKLFKVPGTTPERLRECYCWLKENDLFLASRAPPQVIAAMPDRYPAWAAGKLKPERRESGKPSYSARKVASRRPRVRGSGDFEGPEW